jgi:citrate lyase subunit beta / citryl-CoA lyase
MAPMVDFSSLMSPLFVPADRPERYAKAFAAGADAVIIDLEDAVAPDRKAQARDALSAAGGMIAQAPCPVMVRINAHGQSDHELDRRLVAGLPIAAVILPKAESAAIVAGLAAATSHPVLALIESVRGLAAARAIAEVSARLAFGSIDFAVDLGCAHEREALLAARSELAIASRLAGLAGPIDGVTTRVRDPDLVRSDATYAARLGFGGKLLIHPAQIAPAREGFRPSADDIAWAERILASGDGAVALDGAMVDAPVRARAEQIRRRAAATAS